MSFKWEIMCLYDGVFRRTVTTDGCWCYSIAHNKDFHRRKACVSFHIYMVRIYSIQFGIRADFSETTIISHETPSCTLNVVMHNKYKATRRTTKSCAEHFMSALIFSSDSEQTVGCDCVNTICNERTAPATANRMDGNLCSRSPYLVAVAGGSFTTPVTIQLWNEMVRALRQQQKGHKTSDGYSMVALVRHVANVSVGWGTYCSVIGVVE